MCKALPNYSEINFFQIFRQNKIPSKWEALKFTKMQLVFSGAQDCNQNKRNQNLLKIKLIPSIFPEPYNFNQNKRLYLQKHKTLNKTLQESPKFQ
jgi:hypothetical protein